MDSYTTVSHESWGSRLRGSFKGIIVGVLLVASGIGLLFWGEGRAVRRAKALDEGASTVISVTGDAPQAANQNKLVHFSGEARALEPVRDPLFGVEAEGLKLRREVEMYQWKEDERRKKRKNSDGSTTTETTYSYSKTWSSDAISSSGFHRRSGHENPPFPSFHSARHVADTVTVGDWIITRPFVAKIDKGKRLAIDDRVLERARQEVDSEFVRGDGGLYLGSPGSASIGDVRVRFEVVPPTRVSLVGLQYGLELVPYTAKVGGDIVLVAYGDQTADAMFTRAKQGNVALTWGLRFLGFFVVFIGFSAILKPISVLADRVVFLQRIVETGVSGIAFALAIVVSLVTVAIGWLFYRPLLGIALLVVVLLVVRWIWKKLSTNPPDQWAEPPREASAAGDGPPSAPPPGAAPPPPPPPPPAT